MSDTMYNASITEDMSLYTFLPKGFVCDKQVLILGSNFNGLVDRFLSGNTHVLTSNI
jgi:hypothetical protein